MGTPGTAVRHRGRSVQRRRVLVVALVTVVSTALELAEIPPPETPTEMWPSLAASFVWTTAVWDGRGRPGRALVPHVLVQLAIFVGFALGFGWALLDSLWMAVANVAGGILMAVLYARFRPQPEWSPGTAIAHVGLLVSAAVSGLVVALLGGFPYVEIGDLDRLQLWWTIRNVVYAYVGGVTFMLFFYGPRRPAQNPAPRWAIALLVPLGAAGLWLTYLDPELPLTWFLLLPAILAGSMLTPRGAAVYALGVALGGALATLHPINQFGYEGFLPESLVIDLLLTASTFITLQLAILRDQRAAATAELDRQSRAAQDQAGLLGTVFDTMTDGLVVMDERRRVVMYNAAARQLTGRRIPVGEEIDWSSHFGLHDLTHHPITDAQLPGPGNLDGFTRQVVISREGTDRVLDVGAWPLPGAEPRTLVLFSDVTAQRERLGELTSFAGVVAHDLRSPLAGLAGWLEMAADALDEADPSDARAFLHRAQLSSTRMQQVIEDWLAYTVQRDGLVAPSPVPLDVLVSEVVAPYASTSGHSPVFDLDVDGTVHADPALARQLVANLVSNAVKYTPVDTRPEVSISSSPDDEAGFVRVTVSDRGIGLPEGEEELVFREFHRAREHAPHYTGTGLGLALCRKIVHRHGGTIAAGNNPGGGSWFTFTLPSA